MRSAPTIAFDYRPSRWLLVAVIVMGVLAAMAVMVAGLTWWLRWPLALAAAAYAWRQWRDLRRGAPDAVAWRSDGSWMIRDVHGDEREAELLASRVLAGMIFLQLRSDARRVGLVLTSDNLDPDRLRRLRMRLSASSDAG